MSFYKAVLFDLDGTLVDTAPDLAHALNYVLDSEHKTLLSLADIRPVASDGALGLLKRGFNIDEAHPRYFFLREKLLQYYGEHIHEQTCLFEHIRDILDNLDQRKIPWGIVTNKPEHLTEKLLKKLELFHRTPCIVSGDTLPQRKPHPAPLHHAAKLLNIEAIHCCYIGDAQRDIEAGKAAQMITIAALYGYIHPDAQPEQWKADKYVYSTQILKEILCS